MDSFYLTVMQNRCPECHEGQLMRSWATCHKSCPHCGAVFERWNGSWTIPTVMGYGFGSLILIIELVVLQSMGKLSEPYIEYFIAFTAGFGALAVYHPVKAWSIGLMHEWGYVYADAADSEG